MTAHRKSGRRGFTLLEVLLASLIAILLLGALYLAMDISLRQTAVSRETTDVENLSRGVFNRMTLDLSCSLGPLPPKSGGNSASGSNMPATSSDPSMMSSAAPTDMGTAPATAAPTTPTDPAAAAPAPADSAAAPSEDGSEEAPVQPQAADVAFQGGVVGYESQLTIFVSQLPPALANTGELFLASDPGMQGPSDLWRITYWMNQEGQLCRQVRPWVTADGVRNSSDPDLSTELSDILVPEVRGVSFEYWDIELNDWSPSWDGTAPGPDGISPIGPPRAIRVTLDFEVPAARAGGRIVTKSVEQVIPVRTAPGVFTPEMIEPSTDPGTVTPEEATATDPASGMTGTDGTTTPTPTQNLPSTPATPAPAPAPQGGGGAAPSGGGTRPGGMGGGR